MPLSKDDLPGTLQRSPRKAQRIYAEMLDSAEQQHDSEARAHQAAWAAVRHSYEKVELYERAKRAGVAGRSRMTKAELADALARKQG